MTTSVDKKCIVLGGTGYIGRQTCNLLSETGAQLGFTYFKNEDCAQTVMASTPKCRGYQLDLKDTLNIKPRISEMAKDLGGLDALIYCAGSVNVTQEFTDKNPEWSEQFMGCSAEKWDEMHALNTKGVFIACQAAAEFMIPHKKGNIIVIGSLNTVKPVASPVHFASSKGAIKTMVETLAKTFGDYSILINIIAPGILDGGEGRFISEELKREYIKHCSLGRLGTAEDVAETIVWMTLENTYMTGQTILLDGGL